MHCYHNKHTITHATAQVFQSTPGYRSASTSLSAQMHASAEVAIELGMAVGVFGGIDNNMISPASFRLDVFGEFDYRA